MHFDAHLDSWDTYFKAPTTHGTIFRRAFEELAAGVAQALPPQHHLLDHVHRPTEARPWGAANTRGSAWATRAVKSPASRSAAASSP